MIVCGDCLHILKQIETESVDMIYLDPPFFSQKKQSLKDSDGKEYSFYDVWENRRDYLDYIKVRLCELKRVLKDTGSIFLHCDDKSSHYLRVLLDDIFGDNNFRSEIIWTYKRWSNSKKGLLSAHQTIFFYSKTNNFKFHVMYTDYSPTTNLDQILQERVRDQRGKAAYKQDDTGNIVWAKEKKGVPLSDVWEIPFLNPKAKERVGYPTQKPIELLERIIKISTDEGDTILDPFCGSGTTLVAAKLTNRKGIGIDINPEAVKISKQRLQNPFKTESKVLQVGSDAYKTKSVRETEILNQLGCDIVQRNKGIDGFLKKRYQNLLVAVKIQKSTENITKAMHLLYTAAKKKNCGAMILVRTENNSVLHEEDIPANMILIDEYKIQIDDELERLVQKAVGEVI